MDNYKSERFKRLCCLIEKDDDYGLFPDLTESIEDFACLVVWKRVPGIEAEIPEPYPGLHEDYDKLNAEAMRI